MRLRLCLVLCLVVITAFVLPIAAGAAVEILDAQYRPDRVPQGFEIFWKDGYRWGDNYGVYTPSGAIAVYIRNTGGGSVTINDMLINGGSLANGFYCSTAEYKCALACGTSTNTTLYNAGEPVWWRAGPRAIGSGETSEIFVRMRRRVATTLSLSVQTSAGNVATSVVVDSITRPRIAGCAMSPDMSTVYLYLRHPQKGKLPTQILVDGVDKTADCAMVGDSAYDLVAVKCALTTAFVKGSFHCFQAIHDDGSKAVDGLRVFHDDFRYGRWGGPPSSDENDALFHIRDMGVHSMNLQIIGWGGLNNSAAGFRDIMDEYDIRQVGNGGPGIRSCGIFLCDEPDAGEDLNANIPKYCPAKVGGLSNSLASKSEDQKTDFADSPTFINLNGSFKPTNYYIYGHVADTVGADPYYQTRIVDSYWTRPNTIPLYSKATYIYAVASMCQAASEPSPQHITLNSCRKHVKDQGVFRWGTPEEKRIEVYYSLAAGVKLISYWWFSSVGVNTTGFCGIADANEPGSAALWREMGLLGAELGTASPVLVNSSPATVDVTKPGKLWVRSLLSNVDTLVLLCVNDDYANDDTGTMIRSIKNADVGVKLPSWISSPTDVFEVDWKGVRDVPYEVAGSQISVHLGRVEVTRMVIITKDSTLKSTLHARYAGTYAPRVAEIAPMP